MPHSTSSARTPWDIDAWKRSTMPTGCCPTALHLSCAQDLETLRSHTRKAVPAQYRAGTASVSCGSVRLPELYWPADPWHPG
jgi:hypothetical protein